MGHEQPFASDDKIVEAGDGLSAVESDQHDASSSVLPIDPALERRLVRKFDFRILPVLAIMYLFNSLDKSNLGNAKTAPDRAGGSRGLPYDLNFGASQYNEILSIFFIPYVLTAPFLSILGKKYGPNRVLPCMMFTFGSLTLLMASTFNFSGVFALRWFLGMSESAFFPLVIYYQTTFYRRGELARRLAIFYAAQSIAGAFGGLLAYGTFQIKHISLPYSWSLLFLIEGSCTLVFSIFAFWYLPRSAEDAKFLTPEEKELAHRRILVDSSSRVNEEFVLEDALKILKEPVSWMVIAIEICLGVPLQSVQLFLPPIIKRLGYDSVKTNLYTVAPNVSGAAMLLILAFASDWTGWRWPFVSLGFLFTFVGFVIYAAIDINNLPVAYFATFMMTWGTSAPSVLLDVWYNNNIAHEGKRLLLTSIAVPLANLMGVVSSNIFLDREAPEYMTALITTAAFGGTGLVLTTILGVWMLFDNRRRDRKAGQKIRSKDVPTSLLREGPAAPEFRWIY